MTDREKVIEQLIDLKERLKWQADIKGYGYHIETIDDALTLLEEQKAKPLIENESGWNCPSCGMKLIGKTASGYPCDLIDLPDDEPIHFCPMCGQAVKWE